LVAVLVGWPLGFLYLYVAGHLAINLARHYRGVSVNCSFGRLQSLDLFNGCGLTAFRPAYVWIELLLMTAIGAAATYGLARWVTWPVRSMAQSVARFGPNSLGLRLRAAGPRDETRQLADAIDAMLDRLAEGYEAQRRFAANASHELRTPLATQRALIEVSLSAGLTDEQLGLLARQLLATNERNERLVDGLLTLAETERGLLANQPVRLDAVVAETVESLRASAKEREIELDTALEPLTVIGELALLDRLAGNLIGNAVKYNDPGGTVWVRVAPDGTFTVANTGPPVPAEQVTALFEPFRRLAGERLDHGGGVGLGLTIARSIVAAHGGVVEARANPGGGLVVEVRLPVA
jgi:signal transduction histidine kinase